MNFDHVKIGDPDPYTAEDYESCGLWFPPFICTLPSGHDGGRCVASGLECVVATYDHATGAMEVMSE